MKKTNGITCANACLTMEEHKHELTGIWFYTKDDAGGGPGTSCQGDGSS